MKEIIESLLLKDNECEFCKGRGKVTMFPTEEDEEEVPCPECGQEADFTSGVME